MGKHITSKRLAAAFISAVLLWLAVRRVDAAAMKTSLDQLEWRWFLLGTVVFGMACLFGAARWHCMLALNRCAKSPWSTWRATLSGHLCNTFLFGPAGGDLVKASLYSRWQRCPLPSILAACWMDRLLAGLGSMLFACVLIILAREKAVSALSSNIHVSLSRWIPGICLLAAGAAGVFLWKQKRPTSILSRAIDSLKQGLLAVAHSPASGCAGVLLGMAVQVCLSSVLAFNLRACSHASVPWNDLFWIFPLVSLLSALPITVAGIGVREGASIVLLGLFGVPAGAALTASFLTLATNLVWAFMGGLTWWCEEKLFDKSQIA